MNQMEAFAIAVRGNPGVVERRTQYVTRRSQECDPMSGTADDIQARFPARHSCQYCLEEVVSALQANNRKSALLRDVDQAIEAAMHGCSLYRWLLDFVIRSRGRALVGNEGLYLRQESIPGSRNDTYSVQFLIGTLWYSWACASFDVFTDSENAAASCISTRPFNVDVGSDASFQVAKQWLAECHANHTLCTAPASGFLPTRVVDLKSFKDTGSVQIVPTRSHRSIERAIYATLSYCWGGDQAVKTSLATLNQHLVSIRVSELGQTLQDAIKVALSLGIRFLWVDSLCIVQDDPEDVGAEISRMSEYFENSYVSISAAISSSSNGGFLAPRNDIVFHHGPFELPYRGPDMRLGSIKLATHLKYSSDSEPVNYRAWIMQESLLAPRILSYGYQNLVWSCRTCDRSDGGPYRWSHDFRDRARWAKLQSDVILMPGNFFPIDAWKDLVKSYTERALTVSKDKLPAISGVAQKYHQIIVKYLYGHAYRLTANNRLLAREDFVPDEEIKKPYYAAGLWYFRRGHSLNPHIFCEQLLWTTSFGKFYDSELIPMSGPKSYPNRSLEYRAPSWSWAAVDGPIKYEGWGRHPSIASGFEVLGCRVDPDMSTAPYGTVRAGYLTVKGRMGKVAAYATAYATTSHHFQAVYRPDTVDDDAKLSQVIEGVRMGWLLEVIESGGLLLVEDRPYYRRIGWFSLFQVSGFNTDWELVLSLLFGEQPQIITII